ncbi:MAG: hypothetical protein GY838_07350 [bacterium]|nr:hypothetical protein [bacterium]
MSSPCYDPTELETIHNLPGDDPGRDHLEECVRCRAQLSAYERFLTLGEAEPDPQEQAAEEALGTFLETEILGRSADHRSDEPVAEEAPPHLGRPRMTSRRLAWSLGVAAVLAVAFGLNLNLHDRLPDSNDVRLRTDGAVDPAGSIILEAVSRADDGGLDLTWRASSGATDYRVVLYDEQLREVASFPAGTGTMLRLVPDQLQTAGGGSALLLWRVEALQHGDLVARSALATLVAP